jgi:hypothetical protein
MAQFIRGAIWAKYHLHHFGDLSVHRSRNNGWGLRRYEVKVDLSWLSTFEECEVVFKVAASDEGGH